MKFPAKYDRIQPNPTQPNPRRDPIYMFESALASTLLKWQNIPVSHATFELYRCSLLAPNTSAKLPCVTSAGREMQVEVKKIAIFDQYLATFLKRNKIRTQLLRNVIEICHFGDLQGQRLKTLHMSSTKLITTTRNRALLLLPIVQSPSRSYKPLAHKKQQFLLNTRYNSTEN